MKTCCKSPGLRSRTIRSFDRARNRPQCRTSLHPLHVAVLRSRRQGAMAHPGAAVAEPIRPRCGRSLSRASGLFGGKLAGKLCAVAGVPVRQRQQQSDHRVEVVDGRFLDLRDDLYAGSIFKDGSRVGEMVAAQATTSTPPGPWSHKSRKDDHPELVDSATRSRPRSTSSRTGSYEIWLKGGRWTTTHLVKRVSNPSTDGRQKPRPCTTLVKARTAMRSKARCIFPRPRNAAPPARRRPRRHSGTAWRCRRCAWCRAPAPTAVLAFTSVVQGLGFCRPSVEGFETRFTKCVVKCRGHLQPDFVTAIAIDDVERGLDLVAIDRLRVVVLAGLVARGPGAVGLRPLPPTLLPSFRSSRHRVRREDRETCRRSPRRGGQDCC